MVTLLKGQDVWVDNAGTGTKGYSLVIPTALSISITRPCYGELPRQNRYYWDDGRHYKKDSQLWELRRDREERIVWRASVQGTFLRI